MKECCGNSEQRRCDWPSIEHQRGFIEIKTPFAMHEKRPRPRFEPISFAALWILRYEDPFGGGFTIARGSDGIGQTMTGGVFVVIQIAHGALTFRSGIERLNHHCGD
jgi:hypothetical protein